MNDDNDDRVPAQPRILSSNESGTHIKARPFSNNCDQAAAAAVVGSDEEHGKKSHVDRIQSCNMLPSGERGDIKNSAEFLIEQDDDSVLHVSSGHHSKKGSYKGDKPESYSFVKKSTTSSNRL